MPKPASSLARHAYKVSGSTLETIVETTRRIFLRASGAATMIGGLLGMRGFGLPSARTAATEQFDVTHSTHAGSVRGVATGGNGAAL
jgi:hypothetical protein